MAWGSGAFGSVCPGGHFEGLVYPFAAECAVVLFCPYAFDELPASVPVGVVQRGCHALSRMPW